VQMHASNTVTIVDIIKKYRTSQHWDRARRSQRRAHGNDESSRAAVVDDDESVEEKGFFSTLLSVRGKKQQTE
jgi:hypothetical protein